MKLVWDLVVVGAGPAGTATALGALAVDPSLSVLLVDRADFPRDKACGDGIAPQVLDLLESVGVSGLLDDRTPVRRLALRRGELAVARDMARPAWVVPRKIFDHRLVEAAQSAGAHLVRHRVKTVEVHADCVQVDDLTGAIVVGADGANSVVRRGRVGPVALAIRGYAPTPVERAGSQEIVFGLGRQPSYAWSFDRGDGLSNVGYGEQLLPSRAHPTRAEILERLEKLLPGASAGGTDWRGHHLPLSSWSWRPRNGRVLLAGDAAGLVNPMTGEGIYYAIASGLLAGQSAAQAIRSGDAGAAYRRSAGKLLGAHLRHTALTAVLCRSGVVLDRGIRAAAREQGVFDDLVEIGLANGRISPRVVRGLLWSGRFAGRL
ncbi:geranylgeranyl reductase family protein [Kribbella sp. NPDC006257]|uniref:geranylgeranyl reductase family protein n=1 Tax=Kribbella sp. NPDC006257 TaxID=3156738 RepID=UPI0033A02A74